MNTTTKLTWIISYSTNLIYNLLPYRSLPNYKPLVEKIQHYYKKRYQVSSNGDSPDVNSNIRSTMRSQRSHYKDQIHLIFIFSSPLIFQTSEHRHFEGLPQFNFKDEFEELINGIEKLKVLFRYRYLQGTENAIRESIQQKPIGLHFSGQCLPNKLESF